MRWARRRWREFADEQLVEVWHVRIWCWSVVLVAVSAFLTGRMVQL